MRNITGMIGRYLSGVSLPSMNIIDIIEIILIAFFVYQFMVWIKFTRAYTLLKGLLVIGAFLVLAYIFKMNTILWIFRNLANVLVICHFTDDGVGACQLSDFFSRNFARL